MSLKSLAILAFVAIMATGMGIASESIPEFVKTLGIVNEDMDVSYMYHGSTPVILFSGVTDLKEPINSVISLEGADVNFFDTYVGMKKDNGDIYATFVSAKTATLIVYGLVHDDPATKDLMQALYDTVEKVPMEDSDAPKTYADNSKGTDAQTKEIEAWEAAHPEQSTPKKHVDDEQPVKQSKAQTWTPNTNGELHLNCQKLFYDTARPLQHYGLENGTVIGQIKTENIGDDNVLSPNPNGEHTVDVLNGKAKVIVTNEPDTRGMYYIAYTIKPGVIAKATVDSKYLDFVLNQFVIGGETDPEFLG
jgi:hypothetical protein